MIGFTPRNCGSVPIIDAYSRLSFNQPPGGTKSMKISRAWLLLLTAATALSLAACNTVEGAGKDIKKAGEKIEDAAK